MIYFSPSQAKKNVIHFVAHLFFQQTFTLHTQSDRPCGGVRTLQPEGPAFCSHFLSTRYICVLDMKSLVIQFPPLQCGGNNNSVVIDQMITIFKHLTISKTFRKTQGKGKIVVRCCYNYVLRLWMEDKEEKVLSSRRVKASGGGVRDSH